MSDECQCEGCTETTRIIQERNKDKRVAALEFQLADVQQMHGESVNDLADCKREYEVIESQLAIVQRERDRFRSEVERLTMICLKARLHYVAPCVICGYNGVGYFQPGNHKCIKDVQGLGGHPMTATP